MPGPHGGTAFVLNGDNGIAVLNICLRYVEVYEGIAATPFDAKGAFLYNFALVYFQPILYRVSKTCFNCHQNKLRLYETNITKIRFNYAPFFSISTTA